MSSMTPFDPNFDESGFNYPQEEDKPDPEVYLEEEVEQDAESHEKARKEKRKNRHMKEMEQLDKSIRESKPKDIE